MYDEITRKDLEGFLDWWEQPTDDPKEKYEKRETEEIVQESEGIGVADYIRWHMLKEGDFRFCPLQRAAFLNAWIIKYGDENPSLAAREMDKGRDVERPHEDTWTFCGGKECMWYDRNERECAVLKAAVKGDPYYHITDFLLSEVKVWKSK